MDPFLYAQAGVVYAVGEVVKHFTANGVVNTYGVADAIAYGVHGGIKHAVDAIGQPELLHVIMNRLIRDLQGYSS